MNYIKVKNLGGRGGHQFAEWNTALAISKYYNIGFVHTPMIKDWESQLNFGKGEIIQNNINYKKIVKLPKFNRNNIEEIRNYIEKENNTLFLLNERQNLNNHWLTEDILKKKWKNAPTNTYFYDGFNIGIHIRRGDVTPQKHSMRWISNSYYADVIEKYIKPNYNNYNLHIFSEGEKIDFKELHIYNPIFHLSEDKFKTFNDMIKCDILITGKSGYSYFASIISSGIIIAIPFWHFYPNKNRIIKLKE